MKNIIDDTKYLTKSEIKEILNSQSKTSFENVETIKFSALEYCSNNVLSSIEHIKAKLKEFDLFDFEIIQIIDIIPKSFLDLQLIIEEMEERYTVDQLQQIIEIINLDINKI